MGSGAGAILCNTAGSIACGRRPDRWRNRIGAALLFGLAFGGIYTLVIGTVRALVEGTSGGWHAGVALGTAGGLWLGSFFALPYVLGRRVAGGWAGAVAGALAVGVICPVGIFIVVWQTAQNPAIWLLVPISLGGLLLGLTISWWRPLLIYPLATLWNLALYRLDEQRRHGPFYIRWNATFWDDDQRLPFYWLDEHLLLMLERDPREGQRLLHALMRNRQRWAAQQVLIELDARRLEECQDVDAIAAVHTRLAAGDLGVPASALLHRFSRISEDVAVALQQSTTYHQRLALRLTDDAINGMQQELARSNERYALRFRPIGGQWHRIVTEHIRDLARTIEQRQEIESPYVVGVPLTAQQRYLCWAGRY